MLQGFLYGMASVPVQEEADWLRLFLFENKFKILQKSYMNAF